jgi:hypothetical protein
MLVTINAKITVFPSGRIAIDLGETPEDVSARIVETVYWCSAEASPECNVLWFGDGVNETPNESIEGLDKDQREFIDGRKLA